MDKKSETTPTSNPLRSPATRQPISSVSAMLTPSEIASLRQHKQELIAFGLKAFPPKIRG